MDGVEQIFGAALKESVLKETAASDAVPPSAPVGAPAENTDDVTPTTQPMLHLATRVMSAFRVNVEHRRSSGVTDRLQYALDANACKYSDRQLAALASVGIPFDLAKKLYSPVTFAKTRAAKSMLIDLVNSVTDPLFVIDHSPWPDVPAFVEKNVLESAVRDINAIFQGLQERNETLSPQAEQELLDVIGEAIPARKDMMRNECEAFARDCAKRMQKKVWDIMVEGGWEEAFEDYIANVCQFGTGFIIGPCPRVVAANRCREGKNGVRRYVREFVLKPVYESVSPMDCYPAPDARNPSDGAFCIRVKYSAESLWRFCDAGASKEKNGEGWNAATVRDILSRHPNGGVRLYEHPEDPRKREAEMNGTESSDDCTFEGVRCFISIRGSDLEEIGIVRNHDGRKILRNDYYHVEAIVIDGHTVYCRILDARVGVPVSKGVFYELPGSFWGESIADKLQQVQTLQNNTCKALFLDLAGTGSMFYINDASRLVDKSVGATSFSPYKTIAFDNGSWGPGVASTGAPIGVLDVPSKAAALVNEWNMWQSQADNDSGIPRFAEGGTAGAQGALRTSGGLAQVSEHMMRGMKMVMTITDKGIIRPVAQKTADWVLAYDDDMDLKGDVYVRTVGLIGRILRAQRDQQRLQFFNMVISNQYLQQIVPPKGVVALMRPLIQDVDINPDDILPDENYAKWLEDVQRLKVLASAETPGDQNAAQGGGMQSGVAPVEQPPSVPGGVEERRAAA